MSLHNKPPPPSTIVIFGANGDLTHRLIVPALYNLSRTKLLPERFAIIGCDHNDKTAEAWGADLKQFLASTLKDGAIDEALWSPIEKSLSYVTGDFTKPETYQNLKKKLAEL